MSTKNLARTIIEGGRVSHNRWDRRYSHQENRAQERAYLSEVMEDEENYYEYDIEPLRPVHKQFNDKLGPIYRWLTHQVGRPWDEVRADVAKEFDTRTTAGRHIVYDHMLGSVEVTPDVRYQFYRPEDPTTSHYKYDFYVDDQGILQQRRYVKRRYRDRVPAFDVNRICNWLNGRIVGKVGPKLFWFVPADKNKKRGGHNHVWSTAWGYNKYDYYYGGRSPGFQFLYLTEEIIYKKDSVGRAIIGDDGKMIELERKPKWIVASPPNLRQSNKLNEKEIKFWNELPEYCRTKILESSPNYLKKCQKEKLNL